MESSGQTGPDPRGENDPLGAERDPHAPGRGESALAEIVQILLESPMLHQALQVAVEARDRASQASASAMRNLNVSSASDVDRVGRRLRALGDRLEELEDQLDRLSREVAQLRKASTSTGGSEGSPPPDRPGRGGF